MKKKYHVKMSEQERTKVQDAQAREGTPKSVRKRCSVLLQADESVGKPPSQEEIAKRCGVSGITVYKVVKDCTLEGVEYCLRRRKHESPPNPRIVTGEKEARIVALACGRPPEGRARWTVRLLREKIVELRIVERISNETVRNTLKKRNLSLT